MKTTFTFFLAIFSLFITSSCSSDDDSGTPPPTQADLIVGTWEMTSNTVDDGNATINIQGFPLSADFTWEGRGFDYELTFTENNQVNENGGFIVDLTYGAFGQSMSQEFPLSTTNGNGLLIAGTYEIQENQLLVTNDGATVPATIEELTETTLKLRINLEDVAPAMLDNIAENASGTNIISFTRE